MKPSTFLALVGLFLLPLARAGAAPPPDLAADLQRLRDLNRAVANPAVIRDQPAEAIETIKLIPALREDRQRIATQYGVLLQKGDPSVRDLKSLLAHFDRIFPAFAQAAETYAAAAPAEITQYLDEALAMGDDAVANQRHLYFGADGGIAQRLSWAETRLAVLEALAPDAASTIASRERLAAARARIVQMKTALLTSILSGNRVPDDRYAGADEPALLAVLTATWTSDGTGGTPLVARITGAQWKRETRWEWSRGLQAWQKIDRSRLQGVVVVPRDGETAVLHVINLFKDHLAGDAIRAGFLSDPKQTPDPSRLLLIKNVK